MFLHAALDRFLTQMGNSYSGTKPALPTLNINKVSFRNESGTVASGGRVPAQQASQKQQLHLGRSGGHSSRGPCWVCMVPAGKAAESGHTR